MIDQWDEKADVLWRAMNDGTPGLRPPPQPQLAAALRAAVEAERKACRSVLGDLAADYLAKDRTHAHCRNQGAAALIAGADAIAERGKGTP